MHSVPHFLSSSSLSLSLPLAYFLLSSPFSLPSPPVHVSLSLPITLLVTTPPHLSYSHPRLSSSLTSNDHSSTLQGAVPFSAACSLLQPVQGSPFLPSLLLSSSRHPPLHYSLGGIPQPLSVQMTAIFHHARKAPWASQIMSGWTLHYLSIPLNSLVYKMVELNVFCWWISTVDTQICSVALFLCYVRDKQWNIDWTISLFRYSL